MSCILSVFDFMIEINTDIEVDIQPIFGAGARSMQRLLALAVCSVLLVSIYIDL